MSYLFWACFEKCDSLIRQDQRGIATEIYLKARLVNSKRAFLLSLFISYFQSN
jgi:hypothetical protein